MNGVLPSAPPPSCHLPAAQDETGSPPQNKHKINDDDEEEEEEMGNTTSSVETTVFSDSDDDDVDSSPIIAFGSTYDSEEDYCTDYPNTKMDKPLWERYHKQIKESDGFDIIDYPGGCWMTTVYPMRCYLNAPKNVDKLKKYARNALKHYNDYNGTSYEVENILKVNGSGCRDFTYYISFSVKNGEHDTFKAKVVEDLEYRLTFPIIRPKVKVTMG